MLRRTILPLIACAGIGFALFMIYRGTQKPPVASILFQPAVCPYKHYIAAEGIIETVGKNVAIGVAFPELISDIYVRVGDYVKKNDPLFKLDTRHLEAQKAQALQQEKVAEKEFINANKQFALYEQLKDKSAVSEQAYIAAQYTKEIAAQTLATAQATTHVFATDIERSTIRAPHDGQILQSNISVGQVANLNPFTEEPLLLFGDTAMFYLRIDIDEEDAWRFVPGSPAKAFIRGHSQIAIPLEYAYLEPYIVPKVSLTGSSTERVDTRVLQVVYRFKKEHYPVYIGQILDVYLEAPANGAAS